MIDNDKFEAQERINFFLGIIQKTMKACNIMIGFDLKEKKLIIQDLQTELFSRIELEKLNDF